MNTQIAAVTALSLRKMENFVLAVANNALIGFGKIPVKNAAFTPMKKAGWIDDNGKPIDSESLLAALSLVINERVEAGTFI